MDDQKIKGKVDQGVGQAKVSVGRATGDRRTEAEGQDQQAAGKVREGAGKVKDAVGNAADKVGKALSGDH
jgi:uncharacterized protein YjbJ (UPF0337 family)